MQRAVHGASDPDGETTNATAERTPMVGLGDQMDMVVLHAELDDPTFRTRRRGEGAAHGSEDALRAQARDRSRRAKRHVHRVSRDVSWARSVWHSRPTSGHRLPTGPRPPTAPPTRRWQHQLFLPSRLHLDSANLAN